jgi:hypothetical protein
LASRPTRSPSSNTFSERPLRLHLKMAKLTITPLNFPWAGGYKTRRKTVILTGGECIDLDYCSSYSYASSR